MRPRLTYANVISTVCLFLLLAGGTAIATHPGGQNTISTADIQNSEVKVADVGQGAVTTDEIANNQVKAADIGDGEVKAAELANGQVGTAELGAGAVRTGNVANDNLTGGDVAANSLKGADIDEGSLDIGDAARAYAWVIPNACGTPGPCTPGKSKGISTVTRTGIGFYCLIAPGIDSTETPAAVTVDWSTTDSPEGNASAMTGEFGCGPGGTGFDVVTERHPITGPATVGSADNADDVAFTIVIP